MLIGWIFALLSLSCLAAFTGLGLLVSIERESERELRRLADDLRGQRFSELRASLATPSRVLSVAQLVTADEAFRYRRATRAVSDISFLIDYARSGKRVPFVAFMERSERGLLALASEHQRELNLWYDVRDEMNGYVKSLERIEAIELRLSEIEAAIPALLQRFNDVGTRFASRFGFRFESKGDQESINETYSRGVFAGLPRLKRLPDGLPTLEHAQSAIRSNGGILALIGPSAESDLSNDLQGLRRQITPVTDEYSRLVTERTRLRRERDELSQAARTQAAELPTDLIPIMLELLSPPVKWTSEVFARLQIS